MALRQPLLVQISKLLTLCLKVCSLPQGTSEQHPWSCGPFRWLHIPHRWKRQPRALRMPLLTCLGSGGSPCYADQLSRPMAPSTRESPCDLEERHEGSGKTVHLNGPRLRLCMSEMLSIFLGRTAERPYRRLAVACMSERWPRLASESWTAVRHLPSSFYLFNRTLEHV